MIESESKFNAERPLQCRRRRPHAADAGHGEGHRASTRAAHRFRVSDLTNPEINVRYGAWYLRHLLDRYDQHERLALAAYNAGEDNVDRWQREHVGIQFSETRDYVDKVERLKKIYRRAYASQLGY